jgi:two-component system OmpR family sensor kinase
MTVRRRVFRYVAAAAAVSCALTVAVAVVLVRREISRQRLTSLERQADFVAVVGDAPGALRAGEHVYRVGSGHPRRVNGRRADLILKQISDRADGQGRITVDGAALLYAARSSPDGGVVLIRPAKLDFAEWRPFLWSLLLAGAGGAVAAALASLLLARRLTGPIAVLARATGRLAAGEVDVAVPVAGEDELAELGRSFNWMAGELSAARDAQRGFLESVSHELKTPLTSIRGYAEAMTDGAVDPEQAAQVIAGEAGRLERLVTDLLDLARLQRSEFTVEPVPLDLGEVTTLVADRHRPRASTLGVSLEAVLDGPAPALGDRDRLVQAVSNLVENALRLTPEGGRVTIAARPGAVTVSDTGPGLAAADLPHVFERFYLYERYRSERAVGSGLGLTIVSELATRMGGTIRVESQPGEGAAFTITLPPATAEGLALEP